MGPPRRTVPLCFDSTLSIIDILKTDHSCTMLLADGLLPSALDTYDEWNHDCRWRRRRPAT